ncbi:MAG: TetR/AcrR family transcriptional regulator [Chloroflexota bacterium]
MNRERPDRRVIRTRRALREALIGLILEKGYDAVTVGDIVDRADVGRSTFYAHFVDKDALLLGGFSALPTLWAEESRGSDADGGTIPFTFSLKMFRHADDQRRLFRALVGQRSGVLVQRQLDRVLSDLVRADLERFHAVGDDRALEVAVRFVVSAYVGLLGWWLEHPTPATPEEIDRAFRALVLPGVAGFLGVATANSTGRST